MRAWIRNRYVSFLENEIVGRDMLISELVAEAVENQQLLMEISRSYLDLARAFREHADPDLAEKLDGLIQDASDHVARMEEFTT